MLSSEQFTDPITFVKFAQGVFSPEVCARLKEIEATENFLWELPNGDKRMLTLNELQFQFYQKLRIDIEARGIVDGSQKPQTPDEVLAQIGVYNYLIGSSDPPDKWRTMQFDLARTPGQYAYSQPEDIGLIEASFYLNAGSIGLGLDIDKIKISPETVQSFEEINRIALPPIDDGLYD
jgi:hypothetical protein